jgi:hypothetical protein
MLKTFSGLVFVGGTEPKMIGYNDRTYIHRLTLFLHNNLDDRIHGILDLR